MENVEKFIDTLPEKVAEYIRANREYYAKWHENGKTDPYDDGEVIGFIDALHITGVIEAEHRKVLRLYMRNVYEEQVVEAYKWAIN